MSRFAFGMCLVVIALIGSIHSKRYRMVYDDSEEESEYSKSYPYKVYTSGKHYSSEYEESEEIYKPKKKETPGKVKYTYTFEIEKPKTKKYKSYDTSYKVEKKPKYVVSYKPKAYDVWYKPKAKKCSYSDHGYSMSNYRYVYETLPSDINFEVSNQIEPEYYYVSTNKVDGTTTGGRYKRDLKKTRNPIGRRVKSFRKKTIYKKPFSPTIITAKDKVIMNKKRNSKPFFRRLKSKTVKRNIEGEFHALEEEAKKLDLTLPEIVQFLPETLSSEFKRGRCQMGCSKSTDDKTDQINDEKYQQKNQSIESHSKNKVESTTKKNESRRIFFKQRERKYENQLQAFQTTPSSTIQYNSGNDESIVKNPEPLWYLINPPQQREKRGNFLGGFIKRNFEAEPQPYQRQYLKVPHQSNTETEANSLSKDSTTKLDKVIYDMILQHPEFIKASSNGPLATNPNLRQHTLEFLENLIRNRFNNAIHHHCTNYEDNDQYDDESEIINNEKNKEHAPISGYHSNYYNSLQAPTNQ